MQAERGATVRCGGRGGHGVGAAREVRESAGVPGGAAPETGTVQETSSAAVTDVVVERVNVPSSLCPVSVCVCVCMCVCVCECVCLCVYV